MDNRKISELSSENNTEVPKGPANDAVKNAPKSVPAKVTPQIRPQTQKIKPEVKPISNPLKAMPAKPMVEGINSPKTSNEVIAVKPPAFTDQEKQLIMEDQNPQASFKQPNARLMPESVVNRQGRKQTHFKAIFMTMVVLLLLIFAAYEFYVWELQKSGNQAVQSNYSAASNYANQNNSGSANTSTATGLMPSGDSSTTSSTISSMPFPLAGGPAPTGTPPTTTPPAAPVLQLKITATPTGYLNVRSLPSTSGQILGQVHPGEIYTYTSTKPGWYFISIPNATSGWVSAQYVTLQ